MTKKDKLFSLSVIASIFILAMIYFLNTTIAINTNRTIEMIFTADVKGIVMYFYEFNDIGYVISILASSIQMLVPPIAKLTVINANIKFFGSTIGLLISLIGMVIGLCYAYALGRAFSTITFGKFLNKKLLNKYSFYIITVISILWFWPCMLIGYLSGLLVIDFKKFFSAITIGKLISLCYLVFIR